MKNVGYFINTFLRRSEGFIYEQIRHFRNCAIEVLTRSVENSAMFPYDRISSIEQGRGRSLEAVCFTFLRRSKTLEDAVKAKGISILHAHFGVDAVYALPLSEKYGLPLITTFHGYDITRLPKLTFSKPAWLNYWLHVDSLKRKGRLFLGVSDFISRKLVEKGFPSDKVKTHHLGIDVGVRPVEPVKEKVVLSAGRLVEKKGFEFLIKACAELAGSTPGLKLVICGSGPLERSLKALAKESGIEKQTEFTGWQNKEAVFGLMKRSRLFVLPSVTAADGDAEGLGMVLLEAMALGIPCVATRSGGIPDAVAENETGLLCGEKDHLDLAEKIKVMLSDHSLCIKFGANGRKRVEEKFDIIKQVAKLEKIYMEMR